MERRINRKKEKVRVEILARIKAKKAVEMGEKRREETAGVKKSKRAKHGSIKVSVPSTNSLELKQRLTKVIIL